MTNQLLPEKPLNVTTLFQLSNHFHEHISGIGGVKCPTDKVIKDSTNSNFGSLSDREDISRIVGCNEYHYIEQCSQLHLHVNELCHGKHVKEIHLPLTLFEYVCQLLKWFSERIAKTDTSSSLHTSIEKALDLMKSSIQDHVTTRNICEKSLLYDFHGVAKKENCVFVGFISLSTYRSIMLSIAMIFGYLSPGLFFGEEKVRLSECLCHMIFFYLKTYLSDYEYSNELEYMYMKLKEDVEKNTVTEDTSLIGASCDLVVRLVIDPLTFDNEYLNEAIVLPESRFDNENIAWFSDDFITETTENAEGTYYSVSEHIVRSLEIVHIHLFLL